MQPELVLKPGKEKSLLRRHPWIYATAVARVQGRPGPGETVLVRSADGRFLAWAAYSPASQIRARCWTWAEDELPDAAWLRARVAAAVAARAPLVADTDAARLVFGEADGLPGLIVDRYGRQLVTQFQAAGVEAQRTVLVEALVAATDCAEVYDRSDAANRAREGLPEITGVIAGAEPPALIEIHEHGVRYAVDVRRGHKTGFYLDQRDNRALARRIAEDFRARHGRGLRALNCFCYTGGFSLALLAGGAEEVVSIDSSAEALALARDNTQRNGFAPESAQWIEADVFEQLRRLREAGESFDLVVLDPPKFASSHHHVDRAARAYKDINLNGLRLLRPGGHLLSFSCSGAIDVDLFQKIVAGAVIDARAEMWMRARLSAGFDHPLLMTHPEGEYLKGLWLERREA
jgi:23S rRNA (cytosine1962-C5)-methyltransferase